MTAPDRTPLQNAFYWLCSYRGDNNFYGRLLNSCRRNYVSMEHIASVRVDKHGRFCLKVDLEKFNACPIALQLAILVHEAAHLGFRHHERMIRLVGGQLSLSNDSKLLEVWKILCIAADLTVNDLAVRPLTVGKKAEAFQVVLDRGLFPEKYEFPQGLSMEEYFLLLMDHKNENKLNAINEKIKENKICIGADFFDEPGDESSENGEGKDGEGNSKNKKESDAQPQPKTLDEDTKSAIDKIKHMSGGELERLANDLQRSATSAVRSAVEQTERCRGTVPGCMKQIIEALLDEPKVPWPIVLRNHIKSIISNKLVHTTAQPNIALYPIIEDGIEPFPGYTHDFTFRITNCTDTSGSVGDDAYKIFVSEQVSILRQFQGVELQMIHFDHGIQYEETFTRTSTDSEIEEVTKALSIRHGYGGTDFCAPFRRVLNIDTASDWTRERSDKPLARTDLMVIFTDGFAPVSDSVSGPLPRLKPPCPVIWVICPKGAVDPAMQDIVVTIDD